MSAPEPWKDEEAIEADMQLWLQSSTVEYPEEVLRAFRIGWKAGARYTTREGFRNLVNYLIFKGKEPERMEPNEGNE